MWRLRNKVEYGSIAYRLLGERFTLAQVREVYESALEFGSETLKALGADEDEVAEIVLGVRERDRQRVSAQIVGGMMASRDLLLSNAEDQARESGTVAGPTDPILAPEPGAAR